MPRPYSKDLRSRALQACDEGERPGSVAKRFRVGRASVYLYQRAQRLTCCGGSVLAANVVVSAGRQRTGRGFDGGGGGIARRLRCGRSAQLGVRGAGRCAGTTLDGAGGGGRRQEPRRGGGRWPDGSPDAARLGGSLQCRGSGGAD